MAFIVKKKIHGREYYYLNENKRVNGKVKTKTLAYLGKNRKEAERKAKEILMKQSEKQLKKEVMKDNSKNIGKSKKIDISQEDSTPISIEELATFCKRKGFVYPSGEIYGGFAGFWDFGNLGTELKNNIKKEWWKFHVYERQDIVGMDGSIITNPKTWEASGHIDNFIDVFVVDKKTGEKFKVDKNEIKNYEKKDYEIKGEFNPMFTTMVGPSASESAKAYLRPETAQLIFTNFKAVYENSRLKLPCGIAQIGKAFRNEIAPRDFLFRAREFEQMEMEYFVNPNEEYCPYEIPETEVLVYSAEAQLQGKQPEKMKIKTALKKGIIKKEWHAYWLATELSWFFNLGANSEKFRIRQHFPEELSHYSSDTWDLEYNFPFGWKELEGIADRGNYDLSQHEKFSGKDLSVDSGTGEKVLPAVVCEPSLGVERAFLVFMFDSYFYDNERNNVILKLNPKLAPVKAAVFPIVKGDKFEKIARNVYEELKKEFNVVYDASGSVGRRYARADEQGTVTCVTIDGDSLKYKSVTIRDRDTTDQIRIKIPELRDILRKVIIDGKSILEFGKKVNTRVK